MSPQHAHCQKFNSYFKGMASNNQNQSLKIKLATLRKVLKYQYPVSSSWKGIWDKSLKGCYGYSVICKGH